MKFNKLLLFIFLAGTYSAFGQKSFDSILEKGFEKYENGDCHGAIKEYNKALKENNKNAEAYFLRGVCKSILEKNKEAIEDFNLAIKYDPEYAEAYFEKAYSYYLLEENKEAISLYSKAIEINPDYAEAYINRGSIKHNLNDQKGACEDWAMAESLGMEVAYTLLKDNCID